MDADLYALPAQMERRAALASFIVHLYDHSCKHGASADVSNPAIFAELPAPPEHVDKDLADDCRAIAANLATARANQYKLLWSAEDYANDIGSAVLMKPTDEDLLMRKYSPLIEAQEVVNSAGEHLPIVEHPAVFVDRDGRVLLWSLPEIIPPRRQAEMLKATRCLEAQLNISTVPPNSPVKQLWRSAPTFFHKGVDWKSGSTLLYPAGFALGHASAKYPAAPSADAKSQRAKDWMAEFQTSGGILDGILAVTHPDLYRAAQELAAKLFQNNGRSRALMELWPSCYSSIQVIVNRETPRHRDTSGLPGWLDLVLTLGTYAEAGVMEIRNLGVCVPYSPGTVSMLNSRLLLHGVPKVPGDRICYACYMNKAVFTRFEIDLPGLCTLTPSTKNAEIRQGVHLDGDEGDGEGDGDIDADGSVDYEASGQA